MTDDQFLYVPDAFPPDDPLAVFVLAMTMAANDVEFALRESAAANPPEASDEDRRRNRFYYRVRLTQGFLFEAISTLETWEREAPEVATFLGTLRKGKGREWLKTVRGLKQSTGKKALEHVRQTTFHYPKPGKTPDSAEELAALIPRLDDVRADVDARPDATHTFMYADPIALALSMEKHFTAKPKLDRQVKKIQEGASAFVILARHIHIAYCEQKGFAYGPAEP